MRFVLLLILLSTKVYSLSTFPKALENQKLRQEVVSQKDRVITKEIDWFSAAVDGHVYYRTLAHDDFYHGVGYWFQARTELRPSKFLSVNVRSIFYSGSISSGYTSPTGDYHLFSFYGRWPTQILGGSIETRLMDLGRQTFGQGLLVSQKEMAGIWLRWSRNSHSLTIRVDGTGSLILDDDVFNGELNFFGGFLGAGAALWRPADKSGFGTKENSYYYISSKSKLVGDFGYQFENGVFNRRYAALFSLGVDRQKERFGIKVKAQGRFYGKEFGEKFVGNINNIYISYDQYDKEYTDASNIFTIDDNVYVYSLILDLRFFISEKLEFHTLNEAGVFDYQAHNSHEYYYYRVGLSYYPLRGRKNSITFFCANKVLRDSLMRPPDMMSTTNEPLFKKKNFWGLEMSFRF